LTIISHNLSHTDSELSGARGRVPEINWGSVATPDQQLFSLPP